MFLGVGSTKTGQVTPNEADWMVTPMVGKTGPNPEGGRLERLPYRPIGPFDFKESWEAGL